MAYEKYTRGSRRRLRKPGNPSHQREEYNFFMVTVFLRGGLGNQMFQYAAGLSLSLKNGVPLFLDTTFLNDRFPRREMTYRTFDLDIFNLADTQGRAGS